MTIQLFDSLNFEFIFRCLLAGLCGGVAGFERTKHQKAAGLRTYIIVAVGAALFTIEMCIRDRITTDRRSAVGMDDSVRTMWSELGRR